MGQYCVVCGQLKGEDNICRNPQCRLNRVGQVQSQGDNTTLKRPIRLTDRIKQHRSSDQPAQDNGFDRMEEEPFFYEEPVSEERIPWDDSEPVTDPEEWDYDEDAPAPSSHRARVYTRTSVTTRIRELRRDFSSDSDRGRFAMGLATLLISVILSACGTLLFGLMYLEDFLWRWFAVGVFAPLMAYAFTFLYGWLFRRLGGGERAAHSTRSGMSELFSAITATAGIPNVLLLLTGLLAPMDKSLWIFQCFALLLTITWLASAVFSVVSKYPGACNRRTLLLTVLFVFLGFVTLRSLWVWYLVGEFRFALHIPLNIFFS